ncbi:hypothetical protein JKP88DRAFT_329138 [Tribonema minus]|uniref:BTB domain-containing protein n=1 Tax=Tribonema minus TaxID=303371 RepID=A0A835YNA7_9STRA|nr:hypothetical protein JKP88DRAFT_329138 [Tribonema minus]
MHSSVLRSKVISYPGAERPVRIEIKLDDEADVAAFEGVLWGMYHGKLPAEDMTVERALAIARLADAYDVKIMLCAATEWLNQQASLAWDDALRVYEAPDSVRERLDLKKAQTAMLERAGVLEVAMNDEQWTANVVALLCVGKHSSSGWQDVRKMLNASQVVAESESNASRKRKRGAAASCKVARKQGENGGSEPEAVPPGVKRLHVHSIVLIMHSSVLRSKVISYPGAERPVRIEIKLDDEADVAAFEDVLWGMYHGKLPAEDMTVERALAIARLADAYVVKIMLCAATEWLNQQASLARDDALRVYEAPDSVRDRVDLRKAQTALLERAGDLEVAMNDQQVRRQLIRLPETALVALLRNDGLAVAAESTVVVLTTKWARQHRLAKVPDEVANCIRLKHLNTGFLAGVTHFFPQWTPAVLALLCSGKASPSAWQEVRKMENLPQALAGTRELERPKSSITAAKFKVVMSLNDVAAACGKAVEKRSSKHVPTSGSMYYGGYRWYVVAKVDARLEIAYGFRMALYVHQTTGAKSPVAGYIMRKVIVTCTAKDWTNDIMRSVQKGTADNRRWGWSNFFRVGLAAGDLNAFECWADDAGNLNFDVCAELL